MVSRLSDPSKRLALALALSLGAHAAVLAHLNGNSPSAGASIRWPLTVRIAESEPALPAAPDPARETRPEVSAAPRLSARETRAAGSDAPPAPGLLQELEHYYRGSEVDRRAEPLGLPDIEYPEQALASRIPGSVTLRLLIDRNGVLRDARIVGATPPGIFEDVALRAVRSLSFTPALRNGRAVGSIKVIEVPFYPDCQRTGSCVQAGAAQAGTRR